MSDTSSRTPVTADAAAFANARPQSEATTTRRTTPKMRREERAASRGDSRKLIPAASAFDLLDGEYAKNRKSRMLSVASLGVTGLMVVLLAAQFLRVELEISAETDRYDRATEEAQASKGRLDELSTFGGVPGDIVAELLEGRATLAAAASEGEVDLALVVADLTRAVPNGVTITEVQVDPATTDAAPAKEGDGGTETAAPARYILVTVLAEVQNYNVIGPFLASIRYPYQETWQGNPPRLLLRVEIRVPVGTSERYTTFITDTGLQEPAAPEDAS